MGRSILGDRKSVLALLSTARRHGFTIIPFVRDGRKQYSVFKRHGDGYEEAYNPIVDEWVPGFAPAGK